MLRFPVAVSSPSRVPAKFLKLELLFCPEVDQFWTHFVKEVLASKKKGEKGKKMTRARCKLTLYYCCCCCNEKEETKKGETGGMYRKRRARGPS